MTARRAVFLLPVGLLVACGGSTGPEPVATVDVSPAAPSIQVGATVQLTAIPRSQGGAALTDRQVTWQSVNTAVAAVNATGLVTGLVSGSTVVRATVEGKTGSATVTVLPPPVASVTVTPAQASIATGASVQLTATLKDASGNTLTGRTVSWASSNGAIATVDATGLVVGQGAGTATISATAETVTGTSTVTITAPGTGAVVIQGISPDTMVEGQTATVTGQGFSAVAANNTVTVDGVTATVTTATATSIQFQVPTAGCRPARRALVQVATQGDISNGFRHPTRPAAYLDMTVGQQVMLSNPAQFCLQFGPLPISENYLIGVQSVSEVVTSLTPVLVRSSVASGDAALSHPATPPATGQTQSPAAVQQVPPVSTRWARHRAAEARLLEQERRLYPMLLAAPRLPSTAGAAGAQIIPSTVKVGDTVAIRVPDRTSANLCQSYNAISAVVSYVGTRTVWLTDVANPPEGFSAAQLQALSNTLDTKIFPTDSAYFGAPTDHDQNGRIAIVITQEVNKTKDVLGFVSSSDLVPRSTCPSSNEGEIYYSIAPDSAGTVGNPYPLSQALADGPKLLAHEITHIIQFGHRIEANAPFPSVWEAEGQATLAEEVAGNAVTGRSVGKNYGFSVAYAASPPDSVAWYRDMVVDLAIYFGFADRTTKVTGAPEQCSWLNLPDAGNNGPCLDNTVPVYGVTWSFLRWINDQYGPTYPGGEQGIQRALVNSSQVGFAALTSVIGAPIDSLLAQWAATLYTDDRFAGMPIRLSMTSWNLKDIQDGLVEPAQLIPYSKTFSSFTQSVSVRAGSTAYFTIGGDARGPTSFSALDASGNPLPSIMRLWIVRLQ